MAACYDGSSILLWDVKKQETIGWPYHREGYVNSIAFSPDGKFLVSGSSYSKPTVTVWDVANGSSTDVPMHTHTGGIDNLKISPDGKLTAFGFYDGSAEIWDRVNQKFLFTAFKEKNAKVEHIALSPAGKTIAFACNNKKIFLWDIASAKLHEQPLPGNATGDADVTFINEELLASTNDDSCVLFWNVRTRTQQKLLNDDLDNYVNDFDVSNDKNLVAMGCSNGMLVFTDRTSGLCKFRIKAHQKAIKQVSFSFDGKRLATCSLDSTVTIWDVDNFKKIQDLPRKHKDGIQAVKFSPDGKLLASADVRGKIWLWDTRSFIPVNAALTGHAKAVCRLAFSPDGKLLASAGSDRTICLWDTRTQRQLGSSLLAHENAVWALAFSPDGKTLASGGDDDKINLWNVSTHKRYGSSLPASGNVWSIAFNKDGTKLFSVDEKTVNCWDLNPRTWLRLAKSIANNN